MQLRTGINYTNIDDNNLSLLGDELRPEGNISVSFSEFIEATAKKTFQLLPIGNFVDAYKKATAMREAGEWREPEPFEQYLAGNATYYAEGKVKDFTKDEYRMSKEAWEKSEYYRADIDYQEDMTETLAKMLAENYDNARYRDALLNMRAENNTGLGQVMDTAAGFVTSMAVGIVDPINWLPFASALGVGTRIGATAGQAFLQGAKAGAFEGAISMAISEAMVFQRQRALGEKDLTIADSVMNIAASAVLGGLIGGAVRSYKFSKMTPEERALAEAGLLDREILLDEILLTDKLPHPLQEKADQFFADLNFNDPKTYQFYIDMMPEASLADLIDLFALATHDVESGIKIDVINNFLNNERLLNDVVRAYNVASLMGMHKNAPDLTLENFKEFLQLEKKKAEAQINGENNIDVSSVKDAKLQEIESQIYAVNTRLEDLNTKIDALDKELLDSKLPEARRAEAEAELNNLLELEKEAKAEANNLYADYYRTVGDQNIQNNINTFDDGEISKSYRTKFLANEQEIQQLYDKFGKDKVENFLDNHDLKKTLSKKEVQELLAFNDLAEADLIYSQTSWGEGNASNRIILQPQRFLDRKTDPDYINGKFNGDKISANRFIERWMVADTIDNIQNNTSLTDKEKIKAIKRIEDNANALSKALDQISSIQKEHGTEQIVLIPIHKSDAELSNTIPIAIAETIRALTGIKIDSSIYQSTTVNRKYMDALSRALYFPEFKGTIKPGTKAILIDDTITTGGAIAALSAHIRSQGGQVVGMISALGKNKRIAARPKTLLDLQKHFGQKQLKRFLKQRGLSLEDFTEPNARILLSVRPTAEQKQRGIKSNIGALRDATALLDKSREADAGVNIPGLGGMDGSMVRTQGTNARNEVGEGSNSQIRSTNGKDESTKTTAPEVSRNTSQQGTSPSNQQQGVQGNNGQDGSGTTGTNTTNRVDRPYIKDREDFTLDEQNQIYELEDQVKGLKDNSKLTEQDLDTLVNQPNKALSEADKLDEATRYIMDCIKGSV